MLEINVTNLHFKCSGTSYITIDRLFLDRFKKILSEFILYIILYHISGKVY